MAITRLTAMLAAHAAYAEPAPADGRRLLVLTGVVAIVGALITRGRFVRHPGRRHADRRPTIPPRSTLIAINAGFVVLC